jgi:hypothetical protein
MRLLLGKRRLIRISFAYALLVAGEGVALACSCALGSAEYGARQIATDAAIVAEFEVVEETQYQLSTRTGRGQLVRPLRVHVGRPQRSYRLVFTDWLDTCGSSFGRGRVAVLYRRDIAKVAGRGESNLAHELTEALRARRPEPRLARVRAAVAARRPDARDGEYEDGGLCLQMFLEDPGVLDLVKREAARVGRRVQP